MRSMFRRRLHDVAQVVAGPATQLERDLLVEFSASRVILLGRFAELLVKLLILGRSRGGQQRVPIRCGLPRACKDTVQPIVIVGANRIVFMIVTTSTTYRKSQQPPTDDVDAIVDNLVRKVVKARAHRQESERRERTFVIARFKLSGGQLLEHKLVEREISIERIDDIVTIRVGERVASRASVDVPFAVGIASHVEPAPCPALTVLAPFEKEVDTAGECVWRIVAEKHLNLVIRRRQADQVQVRTAQQRTAVRPRRRRETRRLETLEDKSIDVVLRPRLEPVHRSRRPRSPNRSKRPMLVSNGCDTRDGPCCRDRDVVRPDRAVAHPANEDFDLHLRKRALGRHTQILIDPSDCANQQAPIRISRHDGDPT